jgi:hypothetical protein
MRGTDAVVNFDWGHKLTIICVSDFNYMPGVYALFNSANLNGFKGQFKVFVAESDSLAAQAVNAQPLLKLGTYKSFTGRYSPTVLRLAALRDLPDGDYFFIDADVIVERPCGFLLGALDKAIIISTEPKDKSEPHDVLNYLRCKALGLSTELRPYNYINCGTVAFSLPRDHALISSWVDLSAKYLEGVYTGSSLLWFNTEQEILNMLLRQPERNVCAISPNLIEIGGFSKSFQDRKFPYTLQKDLKPLDQVKYFIHGASLWRPWLVDQELSLKGKLKRIAGAIGLFPWFKQRLPYHRAWAYYTCGEKMPIPIESWSSRHKFYGYQKPLWRIAFGLGALK